jgi:hypothetical protein
MNMHIARKVWKYQLHTTRGKPRYTRGKVLKAAQVMGFKILGAWRVRIHIED